MLEEVGVALLKIAQLGHPVLRAQVSELPESAVGTEDVERLIDDLVETMRDSDGVGLAAPQVHAMMRVFAIEIPDSIGSEQAEILVVINPVVTPISDTRRTGWEGCLSLLDLRGLVTRYAEVRLTGISRRGGRVDIALDGSAAVVAQHECDHLDGILFVDRMDDMTSLSFEAERSKFQQPSVPDEQTERRRAVEHGMSHQPTTSLPM